VIDMKKRHLISLLAFLLVLASVGATVCYGDQAARYVSNQDKKQLFLVEMKEDVGVLTSCLQPQYRCNDAKPKFAVPSEDISKAAPAPEQN
jgi:hypothetical protein